MTQIETTATVKRTPIIVYYDGSCPICATEIAYYRGQDATGNVCFTDVSKTDVSLGLGLTRMEAMRRLHVRSREGDLVSGAVAFVSLWRELPRWRWMARLSMFPGVVPALEIAYRGFLRIRPSLTLFAIRLKASSRFHRSPDS